MFYAFFLILSLIQLGGIGGEGSMTMWCLATLQVKPQQLTLTPYNEEARKPFSKQH